MDADRFDALVRSLPAVPRRTALASLLGAGLTALLARFQVDEIEAKKKRRKKRKRKKKCPPCLKRRRGKCKAKKPDGVLCGSGDNLCEQCQDGACIAFQDGRTCGPGPNPDRTCQSNGCQCPPVAAGNGKPTFAECDARKPEECASGICGCNGPVCPCFCRNADCVDLGGSCAGKGNAGCCQGICQGGNVCAG